MKTEDYALLIWHFTAWTPILFLSLIIYIKLLLFYDRLATPIKWILASLTYAAMILIGLTPLFTAMSINATVMTHANTGNLIIMICSFYILSIIPGFIYTKRYIPQLRRAGYLRKQ